MDKAVESERLANIRAKEAKLAESTATRASTKAQKDLSAATSDLHWWQNWWNNLVHRLRTDGKITTLNYIKRLGRQPKRLPLYITD